MFGQLVGPIGWSNKKTEYTLVKLLNLHWPFDESRSGDHCRRGNLFVQRFLISIRSRKVPLMCGGKIGLYTYSGSQSQSYPKCICKCRGGHY